MNEAREKLRIALDNYEAARRAERSELIAVYGVDYERIVDHLFVEACRILIPAVLEKP